MGLDGYLIKVKKELVIDDFTISKKDDSSDDEDENGIDDNISTDICYWRKNYEVQEWMMNLYHKKGGKKEFNCEYIRITEEDLDNLVEYEKNNKDFNIIGLQFHPEKYKTSAKAFYNQWIAWLKEKYNIN